MSMNRDWGRRESVQSIPGMDSVLDGYGRTPGPQDRREQSFSFRVVAKDQDAAYDLLAAQVAPGRPQRLVYLTDAGAQWFTVGYSPRIAHTLTAQGRGLMPHSDFTVTWRIRPDWRPRFSEIAQVFHSTTVFAAGTVFGGLGVTTIAAAVQPFTIAATGTAGLDLPTLDDTGPVLYIVGPAGGAGGIAVTNGSATVPDQAGALQAMYFTVPFALAAGDTATINLRNQSFWATVGGVNQWFRPYRPPYQRDYFAVRAGVVNQCTIAALGASPATGGSIRADFWRKRA